MTSTPNQSPQSEDMERGDRCVKRSNKSKSTKFRLKIKRCFTCLLGVLSLNWILLVPMFTPLLVLPPLVARLLQFNSRGDYFIKAIRFKYLIKLSMFWPMLLFFVDMAFYFPRAKFTPGLKHVTLLGLPLTNWLTIACMIFGFYALACLLSFCIHALSFSLLFPSASGYTEGRIAIVEAVSEIITCLIFWWGEVEVLKRVTAFKQHKILGLPTSEWVKQAAFGLIGYDCITVATHLVAWPLLWKMCTGNVKAVKVLLEKELVSYYVDGMKRGIDFVLSSVMLLLIWVLYFGSHLNRTAQSKHILHFGTQTLVSILICSLLWLLKTGLVLTWQANEAYSRLESKILDAGTELYLLELLGGHRLLQYNGKTYKLRKQGDKVSGVLLRFLKSTKHLYTQLKNHHFDMPLSSKSDSSMSVVHKVAQCLLRAEQTLSDDEYVRDIKDTNKWENLFKELVKCESKPAWPEDWKKLNHKSTEEKIKWINEALMKCLKLASTINSDMEVVDCLDKIVSWAIIGATFILWLLLTNLATTKVLVLIASPLLAVNFIFGDTCKNLFHGFMFVYVVHPFDVDDKCEVEDCEMQVVRIDIWKTTFLKKQRGKFVEVFYPNSELITKKIINYKVKSWLREPEDVKSESRTGNETPKEGQEVLGSSPHQNPSIIARELSTKRTRSMPSSLSLQRFATTSG